jgi:hypothetical protein
MINNIIELLILIIISTSVNFNKKVAIAEEKLDLFYKGIEDGAMSYVLNDEVYLIFDYAYIDEIADVIFKDDVVYIEKINSTHFVITIFVEEKFLNKKVREEIYIRKGDLYD